MKKVVHVMPYDGIGGVERAAASADGAGQDGFQIELFFVFLNVSDRSQRLSTFNPIHFWTAAGRLKRLDPDLVVLSLWRALIVGAFARIRGCRVPMVVFLHNARDAHFLDCWVTRSMARTAVAIWADSQATIEERMRLPTHVPGRVISFLLDRREAVRLADPDPSPDFVFWGRLASQKDPLRCVCLFGKIKKIYPSARLTMIGPDGGLREALLKYIKERNLEDAVTLTGPLDRVEIEKHASQASFYLQTSHYEGMSLAVIEAMQAGLVPIVTPVGEIQRYTEDGQTAIWIGDDHAADDLVLAKLQDLIEDPDRWRAIRQKAVKYWRDQPLYRDDVLAAALELQPQAGKGR